MVCGLPCYLSGDVSDWHDLAHRTTADPEQAGIQLLLDHTARAIDPGAKRITITNPGGGERQLGYDQLVVGTGTVPVRPPIDGLDLDGVHVLDTMGDTFALHHALTAGARSAGYWARSCAATTSRWSTTSPSRPSTARLAAWYPGGQGLRTGGGPHRPARSGSSRGRA